MFKLELCMKVDPGNSRQSDSEKVYGWFNLPVYKEPHQSRWTIEQRLGLFWDQ